MTLKGEGGRYWDDCLHCFYPWYVKPALEILDKIDPKGKRVFEYGSGDSSIWYRTAGYEVHSVDHNKEWARKSGAVWRRAKGKYLSEIERHNPPYDIVVIDGEHRDECIGYALAYTKPGSIIIIDNFHQPSVQADWPITDELTKNLIVEVYKQEGHYDWQTAIIRL